MYDSPNLVHFQIIRSTQAWNLTWLVESVLVEFQFDNYPMSRQIFHFSFYGYCMEIFYNLFEIQLFFNSPFVYYELYVVFIINIYI